VSDYSQNQPAQAPVQSPADWYPDPFGRFQMRYWDGREWTSHVSTNGETHFDLPYAAADSPIPQADAVTDRIESALTFGKTDASKIQQQVAKAGTGGAGIDTNAIPQGGGTLFTEHVLVVNQVKKLIEVSNQYMVYDRNGTQLGYVNEVGQSSIKKVVRLVSGIDQFLTHTYEICDINRVCWLRLVRPAKIFKSKFQVQDGQGNLVGEIVQENMIGKIRFGFIANGNRVGGMKAENWRAWDFRIEDAGGNEVAKITKTWGGLATAIFTNADNYVVQIHRPLEQPLQSMVVAASLCVDTALKQDDRGII
jgi:uncharacterized protein YxjI